MNVLESPAVRGLALIMSSNTAAVIVTLIEEPELILEPGQVGPVISSDLYAAALLVSEREAPSQEDCERVRQLCEARGIEYPSGRRLAVH